MQAIESVFEFRVKYRGQEHNFVVSSGDTPLVDVGKMIESRLNLALATQKIMVSKLRGVVKVGEFEGSVHEAGIESGHCYFLMGTPQKELNALQNVHNIPRMRSFEDELVRERLKKRTSPSIIKKPNTEGYAFQRFEVLHHEGLHPAPEEAEKLLHRLALDPGIVGLLQKHKWAVGLLSEMPPEGKVGISQACVLGYNVNKGQEIALRLRTDDRKGFRKYLSIRDTLVHELVHMVWSDHDENFRKLNSVLLKECREFVQRHEGGYVLSDATAPDSIIEEEVVQDGQMLGGSQQKQNAREAARVAAIRRAQNKTS